MEISDPKRASSYPTSPSDGPSTVRTASGEHPSSSVFYLEIGTVLGGRYEILETIGQGGMGVVYKAHDRELERVVALKVIRPDLAGNPSALQRFKQELVLARGVTHRNITRIYDLGEAEGLKFITMEYIEGEDLRSLRKKQGSVPFDEAVSITKQICAGLQAAHSEGIIHRDLKPGNIMRDTKGRVVIMDFGLARSLETEGLTQTGALVGTVEYMSPEQAKGQALDARSDLFAVGLIFYELLTGKMPYKADSAVASLLKRTQERAVPPSEVDHSVPRVLSEVVSRCLEPESDSRYQTAQQIIEDLEAWEGKRERAVWRPVIGGRRFRWRFAAGSVVLVLVAASSWFVMKHRSQPPSGRGPVLLLVADFDNRTSDAVFDGSVESAFSLALEGASFINTFNRTQARKIAVQLRPEAESLDESSARLVALREGINVIVAGSVAREAGHFKISSTAVDAVSGKTLVSADVEAGNKEGVLQAVGILAARIRAALGDTTPESVQRKGVETFSASSLEAAHEYALAQDLQWAGKLEEAATGYKRAIELDANLGRAFAGLAVVHANMGRRNDAENYYQMAMAHLDRMTEREKYRTRGGYFLMRREPKKAIEEYRALVEKFPADEAGLSNLAFAYFELRDMDRAVKEGRKAVMVFPNGLLQRTNLALYTMYAGDFEGALKEAGEVMQRNPSYLKAHLAKAISLVALNRLEESRQSYRKLESISGRGASMATMGLADLALYQGKAADAVTILEKRIAEDLEGKRNAAAANKLLALADAHLMQGQTAQALDAVKRALKVDQQESTLFLAGRAYLQAGQPSSAMALASQLQASIESEPRIYGKLLEADVLLHTKSAKRAVALIEDAQAMADTWLGRFGLGRTYLDLGLYTEAYTEFENCLKRRGEATAVFLDDVPSLRVLPPVYYYLGRAQEGLKSPAAKESYSTFLSIQGQAATSSLVADARRRIGSEPAN